MLETLQRFVTVGWPVAIVLAAGLIGHYVIFRILLKLVGRTRSVVDNSLVNHCYRPLLWIVILLVVRSVLPPLGSRAEATAGRTIAVLLIIIVCWLVVKTTSVSSPADSTSMQKTTLRPGRFTPSSG
ncbi:MAG: hypothetical protein ACYSUC_12180 [Planctomycetota bacterium]